MCFGWATWFPLRPAPHFLCRHATGNLPADRRKPIAVGVSTNIKKQKMTTKLVTGILLFLSLLVCGQEKIENKSTENHQNIKGTKISLISPKGFISGQNFLGLQQIESGSSIMITEIPGPYSEIVKGMTKENFLSKGVKTKKFENLTINGLPAILIHGTQNAYGYTFTKYILVFGTDSETIMINGAFPDNMKEIGVQVKESILSAIYDEKRVVDPFETIDYSIDASKAGLKFGKNISNSLIFTTDGIVPTNSIDKTSLMVSKSFSTITIEDKKLFVINRLKQLYTEETAIKFTNEISIDGINGFEVFAETKNKKTNNTEYIYQVILFSDNLYYIIIASTPDNSNERIEQLKETIKTFKRK